MLSAFDFYLSTQSASLEQGTLVYLNVDAILMKFKLIVTSFTCLLVMLISQSCKENQNVPSSKIDQIATLTYSEKGKLLYEVQLFRDSTFLIPKKYSVTESSSGIVNWSLPRLYFTTTKGQNELCDFYYVDTARRTLWINKGCGDKQDLKIESWR